MSFEAVGKIILLMTCMITIGTLTVCVCVCVCVCVSLWCYHKVNTRSNTLDGIAPYLDPISVSSNFC